MSFHEEGLILNVYALNKNSKYKNQNLKELKGKLLFIRSVVSNFVTPWTAAHQASLSFRKGKYWTGKSHSTIIVGDFSVLLLVINRTSRQEISEGVGELNNITNQLYLADILE